MPNTSDAIPKGADVTSAIEVIQQILKFVFSGLVLGYIAIIVTGKLLAHAFPGRRMTGQWLRLPLYIVNINAENEEVILGMAGFITTLVLVALLGGEVFYAFFVRRIGFDLGQFNTLCTASAFFSVIWSAVIYVCSAVLGGGQIVYTAEHQNILGRIVEMQEQKENVNG
jgi:hypothetical protein